MQTLQIATQINVDMRTVWMELSQLDRYTDWLSEDCYVLPPMSITRRGDYTWLFDYQNGYQVYEVTAESLGSLIQFELRDYNLPLDLASQAHRFELGEYDDGSTYVSWTATWELDPSIGRIQRYLMNNELSETFNAFMYLSLRRFKNMMEDRKNANDGIYQVAEESAAAINALAGNELALPSAV